MSAMKFKEKPSKNCKWE